MKKVQLNQIPSEILNNSKLNSAIDVLPKNYNFEIHKTIWKIQSNNCKRVALQMPEGLLLYCCTIADIIQEFTSAETLIMGDVTYGACCIDDYSAKALDCDLIVHYGHSCLIPIDVTDGVKVLYIFVDIKIDVNHFIETVKFNIDKNNRIALVGTIQFATSIQAASRELIAEGFKVNLPQAKPLSPGEILGCTAPGLVEADIIIYLGDGRFHLESIMIANENLKAYKYDPYSKIFSVEYYDFDRMKTNRKGQIEIANKANTFGLILSTLGRQGSVSVLDNLLKMLKKTNKDFIITLMSEIFPQKLKLYSNVDSWIQVACPRLSIDWGIYFDKPLLTPYEAMVCLKEIQWQNNYPMDYYSNNSLGNWTVNFKDNKVTKQKPLKIEYQK